MTTRVIMNTSRPNGSGGTYKAGVEYDLADDLAELWRGQGICRRTSVRSEQTGAVVSATAGNFPDAPGQSQDLPLTVRQSAQGVVNEVSGVEGFSLALDSTDAMRNAVRLAYGGNAPGPLRPLAPPSIFAGLFPFSAYFSTAGAPWLVDPRGTWRNPEETVLWASISRGNDTTGDGTYANPYKGIKKAVTMAGSAATTNVTIYVEAGFYDRSTAWQGSVADKNINLIGIGHVTSSISYEAQAWSADTTGGVFKATRSTTGGVFDKLLARLDGSAPQLSIAASLDACRATPNSTYTDGTTLYVHRFDGAIPTFANTLVIANTTGATLNYNRRTYFEGIIFEGGSTCTSTTGLLAGATSAEFFAAMCEFRYAVGNALADVGLWRSGLYRCCAYQNGSDGFNRHIGTLNGVSSTSVEIECWAWSNGPAGGADNFNGFTVHEACNVARFNCRAWDNAGPNFADIDTGNTWLVGCYGGSSRAAEGTQRASFQILHTRKARLDRCEAADDSNTWGLYANSYTGADVAVRNSKIAKVYGVLSATY